MPVTCLRVHALRPLLGAALAATLASGLTGCASVPAGAENPKDPLQSFNRGVYRFNDALDRAVLKPAAQTYQWATPRFVRVGVRNFFANLNDITVSVNDVLQGKVRQSGHDALRFTLNTTFGLLGLVDVATGAGFEKHNEDFGQTLGVWGVGPGPYLVLPLLGPSTVRDALGRAADIPTSSTVVFNHWSGAHKTELFVLDAVQQRQSILDAEAVLDEAVLGSDRYNFLRDAYLQRRQSLVYDGNPPADPDDVLEDEPPAGK